MSSGIAYIAFGRNYNYQGAFSARSVRALCELPIHVWTNVPMEPEWDGISGVTVEHVDGANETNRAIKTDLCARSPFDRTLYLDTDTLVVKKRFILGFGLLGDYDLMGVPEGKPLASAGAIKPGIYAKAHAMFGYRFPLLRLNGGVLFFRKSPRAARFFELWRASWEDLGRGRDMPCLAWALQQVPGLSVRRLSTRWNCTALREDTIIAHALGGHKVKGIPAVAKYIPDMHNNDVWLKRSFGGIDLEAGTANAK